MNVYKNPTCFSRWSVRALEEIKTDGVIEVVGQSALCGTKLLDYSFIENAKLRRAKALAKS